jgi:hypothetical protein
MFSSVQPQFHLGNFVSLNTKAMYVIIIVYGQEKVDTATRQVANYLSHVSLQTRRKM